MRTPIVMEVKLEEAERKITILQKRGEKRVHLDVGDGLFSEMLSVTPADLTRILPLKLELDIHLLTDDPTEWIEECGLLKPQRVIGQIERMGTQELFLKDLEERGMRGGLALRVGTPIESLDPKALSRAAVVLLLAVPAGESGAEFDERVLPKIKELRERYRGKILVDGGINAKTEKEARAAGADETAANSDYWGRIDEKKEN